jgi:hypothetical protein
MKEGRLNRPSFENASVSLVAGRNEDLERADLGGLGTPVLLVAVQAEVGFTVPRKRATGNNLIGTAHAALLVMPEAVEQALPGSLALQWVAPMVARAVVFDLLVAQTALSCLHVRSLLVGAKKKLGFSRSNQDE